MPSFLLLQTGDRFLLQSGDRLLLTSAPLSVPKIPWHLWLTSPI